MKCAQRSKCPAQSPDTCPRQQPSCSLDTCPPRTVPCPLQQSKHSDDSFTLRICSDDCPKRTVTKTSENNNVTCPFASLLEDLTNTFQEPRPPKSKSTVEPPRVSCIIEPDASSCSISPCSTPKEPTNSEFPCDSTYGPSGVKSHRDSSQSRNNSCEVSPCISDFASCQEDPCPHYKGPCPPPIPSPGSPFRPCIVSRIPCAQSTPYSPQESPRDECYHRDSSQTKTKPCELNPCTADLISCQEDPCSNLISPCPPPIPSPGPPFRPCLVSRVPCAQSTPCELNPYPADLISCQEDPCLRLKGPCPPPIPSPGLPIRPCIVSRVPCAQSTPCSAREDPKEESFVASTFKDIVTKITSLASSAIEYISDDGSGTPISPCDKDRSRAGRRSVQFKPCADCRDIEELYFNKGLKSAVSVECDPCSTVEVPEPTASCLRIKDEECSARKHSEESGAGSSVGGSGGSGSTGAVPACDAARADYYHKKLMATLQVLQNKEETVRVQAASLSLAEQRIQTLTAELDKKDLEVRTLRKASCPSQQKREACTETTRDSSEVESQKKMVKTLQNNLSVIEDLYRECFYETAKQDELIEKLRKSYLDVRLMEKEKADHIGRLQNVVNSQRWSLECCQNVSAEVENLKMEISNFLNSSNNDSGMWEESMAVEVNEDLQDIMQQLLLLKQVLQKDCTCGLQEENKSLKERNQVLERQLQELRESTVDFESAVLERDETIKRYKKKVDETNDQMECLRQELCALRKRDEGRCHNEECLRNQLRQAQEALEEKKTELEELQKHCTEQDGTIKELQVNVERAEQLNKENQSIRSEIQYLSSQVSSWRRALSQAECRARCLEDELMRARTHTRHVDTCYREKASAVTALREQLETAHARGAALCVEARQAVSAVRRWLVHMKDTNAEQEEKIKEQESTIASLTQMLQEKTPCSTSRVSRDSGPSIASKEGRSCDVKCPKRVRRSSSTSPTNNDSDQDLSSRPQTSTGSAKETNICRCSRVATALRTRVRETDDVALRTRVRETDDVALRTRVRETDDVDTNTPIAPPRRDLRRKTCEHTANAMRASSPTEELCSRVERLSDALADGQRRWSRDRLRRP